MDRGAHVTHRGVCYSFVCLGFASAPTAIESQRIPIHSSTGHRKMVAFLKGSVCIRLCKVPFSPFSQLFCVRLGCFLASIQSPRKSSRGTLLSKNADVVKPSYPIFCTPSRSPYLSDDRGLFDAKHSVTTRFSPSEVTLEIGLLCCSFESQND